MHSHFIRTHQYSSKKYEAIHYKLADLQATAGDVAVSDDVVTLLMNRMRWPSVTIHGIEGAVSDPGTVTIIPNKVAGKFSMRCVHQRPCYRALFLSNINRCSTVPPQTPDSVKQLIDDHLRTEFKKLGTKCTLDAIEYDTGDAWVADYDHWNYGAAAAATREVYGMDPDFTREGEVLYVVPCFFDSFEFVLQVDRFP